MANDITQEEREGVRMIQALRQFLGERETPEVSLRHWRDASDHVRDEVRKTYNSMIEARKAEKEGKR